LHREHLNSEANSGTLVMEEPPLRKMPTLSLGFVGTTCVS
jgi:hypothetical protein